MSFYDITDCFKTVGASDHVQVCAVAQTYLCSGGFKNFGKGFPLVVDPRCRGLEKQPPAAEEIVIFRDIQCNKNSTFPVDNPQL